MAIRVFNVFFVYFCFLIITGCGGSESDNLINGSNAPKGPYVNFQTANTVIGQSDFSGFEANQGGEGVPPDANTIFQPTGRAASGSLFTPDSSNHRILGFNKIPSEANANADFVIGQADFTSNSNRDRDDNSINFPSDVWSDGTRLFVVDFNNNRVLIWNNLPTGNSPADVVVGQPDFESTTAATSETGLKNPQSVAAAVNVLTVADRKNNRILIWNNIPTTNAAPADVVVGQTDFSSASEGTSATQLNEPRSVWTDGARLVVADTQSHRVLIWNSIPANNGAPADVVIGQPDFDSAGSHDPSERTLKKPRSVYSDGTRLFIADTDNHRVLVYLNFPTANNAAADIVIGQNDFTHNTPNDDDQDGTPDETPNSNPKPSARTLNSPTGVFATADQMIITDNENNRILIFDAI